MKTSKKNLLSILFILFSFISNAQKSDTSGEVNFVSEIDGTVTVRAIGYGSNMEKAKSEAELKAIEIILFRGLPESSQNTGHLEKGIFESNFKNTEYFENFYGKKGYKNFIMSSIPTTKLIKNKGGKKSLGVDIKINSSALRTDLEQNKIIRKFGF